VSDIVQSIVTSSMTVDTCSIAQRTLDRPPRAHSQKIHRAPGDDAEPRPTRAKSTGSQHTMAERESGELVRAEGSRFSATRTLGSERHARR